MTDRKTVSQTGMTRRCGSKESPITGCVGIAGGGKTGSFISKISMGTGLGQVWRVGKVTICAPGTGQAGRISAATTGVGVVEITDETNPRKQSRVQRRVDGVECIGLIGRSRNPALA